jgi:hypothetical protein
MRNLNNVVYLFRRSHYGEGEASLASPARGAACPCRGVNATGRVVHGAVVARARAVRGTEHRCVIFTP